MCIIRRHIGVNKIGERMGSADEIGLTDDKEFATLDDFVRIFWEKAVEKILNVVETQGR